MMRSKPRLIALTGPKGVGKSTYAKFIAGENGVVLSFASPLKEMLRTIVDDAYIYGNKKGEVIPHLGVTGRFCLQTLGTEWGRMTVNNDIWVNCMRKKLTEAFFDEYHPVIIDDLRFENEADLIHELDGEVWELDRKNFAPESDDHVSEAGVKSVDRKVLI